ncbi:hypothetical protein P872_09815 [Rhodonellum psychrophilum GCM71 = DSM 17998]|uniref:Uncharacterized protein n=2 Tax=Rhodonellum TaxID=336827 RepID=U5BUM0_9BACT|nr:MULTISPECIES: hypothetical protein [Rhodonellum]ERM81573.1 hypothetical protein P872_09815 [Rhodonellum psychrophilum GCM71 = DSM 17998]MDO9553936.1 hypothetical protein [Rhodonellum sp.]SDZ54035.1 hypothetical protein SAMN05444412_1224 [Rhodonellum ikkaensis]
MKIASLADIKKELNFLSEKELIALITDLSKFNMDNKKYLFFKLYERDNPRLFIEMVQEELKSEFQNANISHYHLAKKSAQGIRRKLNKFLKISKDKAAQIELIIDFCKMLQEYGYLRFRHPVIDNLYKVQVGKVEKLISGLHEDLQYDFQDNLDDLKDYVR